MVKKLIMSLIALFVFFGVSSTMANAQVIVGIGEAPACPYGYYDSPPYDCAPFGYYGNEWFVGGIFRGAGPWFHGDDNFHGRVNNRMHPNNGYKGQLPQRGEKPQQPARQQRFKGNEVRDGRGHVASGKGSSKGGGRK